MLHGRKVVAVLPAYRAESTLEATVRDIPREVVDYVLLVDDGSDDGTVALARRLGLTVFEHDRNRGYGANQKTCYTQAIRAGADIVVMLHPDYQYEPKLLTAMAGMIGSGVYDVVLGSRILGKGALAGGMPLYKYFANRALTAFQNVMQGCKLSEFHTGYRAFSREVLLSLPLQANSDDFVFDNQILAQCIARGYAIGEISCPTKYFPEASSISFRRSVRYGLGVLATAFAFRAWKLGLAAPQIFSEDPADRLDVAEPP